jgi:large subunit ribosomal protein L31
MKSEIHPDYHTIKVVMTDEPSSKPAPLGQEGDVMRLTSTPSRTPPGRWPPALLDRGGRLSRFQKKFSGFPQG